MHHFLDLAPTLLEIAGVEVPDDLDGQTLVPLLKGQTQDRLREAFCEFHGCHMGLYTMRMLQTDRYKYIFHTNDIDELYDHEVDPYELPTMFKAIREEIKVNEPSVIVTNKPCVLIDEYQKRKPYEVLDDKCTGCGNCVDVGCPAIFVTRREKVVKNNKERELAFVRIETAACTGCHLCVETCAPDAIVQTNPIRTIQFQ